MYLFFIGNPTAGAGKAKKSWMELEVKLLELGWRFDIRWSASQAQISTLVKDALLHHPDMIVSLGGDGTAHEVIKAMYAAQLQETGPLFTVFPKGTGNDWARYWRIPHKIHEWIEMVKMKKTYVQDLGQVAYMDETGLKKSEVFNNVAGMAYDIFGSYSAVFLVINYNRVNYPGPVDLHKIFFIQSMLVSALILEVGLAWSRMRCMMTGFWLLLQ